MTAEILAAIGERGEPESGRLNAVIELARRFGPVWPQTPAKTGYRGTHGSHDATRDEAVIERWCFERPGAVFAVMTGEIIVALDIDLKSGRYGLDTLEALGVLIHPETVTAHTPSGGIHLLFEQPAGRVIRSSSDRLGSGLEVKGEKAWITLPPGPGRSWDPHLGLNTPLAPLPEWLIVDEPNSTTTEPPRAPRRQPLSRYAEAALDGAVRAIVAAPAGQQHDVLNREAYSVGGLVAGGIMPAGLAIEALGWAARQMRSHDPHRPWRATDVDKIVRDSFADGLARPRQPERRA